METMTLTINLPGEIGTALEDKAKTSGKKLAEYVESMITAQVKSPTLRQYFADVREGVLIDDDEMEKVIDAAIADSRVSRG